MATCFEHPVVVCPDGYTYFGFMTNQLEQPRNRDVFQCRRCLSLFGEQALEAHSLRCTAN